MSDAMHKAQNVTDGLTDRRTDRNAVAMVSRAKKLVQWSRPNDTTHG